MIETPRRISVLVVDDSALMRKMIGEIIEQDPSLQLAGTARNGQEALDQIRALRPDVVTLDIEMPVMDGLQALARYMADAPTATVMLSAHAKEGAEATLLALELGAVDFITKPSGSISLDIDRVRADLVGKIKVAAGVDLAKLRSGGQRLAPQPLASPHVPGRAVTLVAIGSSTGGTRALSDVLPSLPAELGAAYLLVQHMPLGFTRSLAERLNARSKITVKEAEHGDPVRQGQALLAPAGYHLELDASGQRVSLNQNPTKFGVRPSVDIMMQSVAARAAQPLVGVILTGMGHDGAQGMLEIRQRGGRTIAEDKSTCVVYGMPKSAIEAGAVEQVLPLDRIPEAIIKACE
ncbi:MAG TPA: chemotaxis response regulator protein-glutamate methylesterase [Candidatus Edwardsbacteria bacterium]|nr:chemotaxis response regulator protein-glutamate methylesterase [Candidatus Edwardsbacteria bacterium]